MPIDERQLEVDAIMDILEDAIRYDINATIPSISKREHKLWIAQNPAPGENRSMIGNTDFKPPEWSTKPIKLIRPKSKIRQRRK